MASSGQNQGLQIAVIIFVILTVLSMGFAVVTSSTVRELRTKVETEQKRASDAEATFESVQGELDFVKELVGLQKTTDTLMMPDRAATEEKFKADLKKYGERLKAVQADASSPANYSQSLDAVLTVLEQRNAALEAEKIKVVDLEKQKAGLEATYQAQVVQFKKLSEDAEVARAEAVSKADAADKAAQLAKQQQIDADAKRNEEVVQLRAAMQKDIDDRDQQISTYQATVKVKDDTIANLRPNEYAATYDGQVTRVNPSTRTVWINLGSSDNLQKHLGFSVQPQGIPPGSKSRPKGRIEVTGILDSHLAECRILEDDLENPILPGDNIFTPLWEPGQQTHFSFAGRIDLDGDGGDDIDRVRALVDRAAGKIDAVAKINGDTEGELTIETRYLVLGTLPADKLGTDAYNAMLAKAVQLGVQRVPVAVFLDQIGYRREDPRVVFGGGAANAPKMPDQPDGGPRTSNGTVSDLFQKRRPPAATSSGSAY